ncbi:sugar phosphate isomerase/epimerase family protein [Agathobaculum sp. NTUH-O15-33]|uniref:sugar phosphate isomerase/epimerase family protein n=1 Tax=Agathobaculum sp. NTUH-O15-33 TaxID=3079302 RepID=UPI0029586F3C|nr:sugar phosphate isomerase/epimerase family protein [Agathobaculum sp. NTUH-O15-33]WNX84249.1 sugar phosphate isomerase/epimerase family protein [Agathobaculum sp. NTUH-O15-33]
MMKIGLNTNTFAGEPLAVLLPMAKDFGITYLELWGSNLAPNGAAPVNFYAFSDKDLQTAKRQIADAGLLVGSVSSGLGLDTKMTSDPEAFSRELVATVEAAAFFGAKVVNHYSDKIQPGTTPELGRLHDYFDAALKRAAELGITLALENEAGDASRTPENMLAIMQAFDSPFFKTNFDATNYYHASCEAFPYAYELLREHIAYVHIKNGRLYRPGGFCPDTKWFGGAMTMEPGTIYYCEAKDGVVNIDGLVHRLAADGYDGLCTLEPHTTRENAIAAIHGEVKYLRATGLFE